MSGWGCIGSEFLQSAGERKKVSGNIFLKVWGEYVDVGRVGRGSVGRRGSRVYGCGGRAWRGGKSMCVCLCVGVGGVQ